MRVKTARKCGAIAIGLILLFIAYWRVSYRPGPQPPLKACSQIDLDDVVRAAEHLKGIMYDPLEGRCGNLGGRLGFIVCIDVPVVAFRQGGLSIEQLLADDFRRHPEAYVTKDGNTPHNPFFHRRARNLYSYCVANGCLLHMTAQPQECDVVFYKKPNHAFVTHIAMVTKVESHGKYWLVEASPETFFTQEKLSDDITSRGWEPQGIGRLLPLAVERDMKSLPR